MDPITQQVVLATAGAAAAGEATYVDDVFSTFLYEGTNSAKTITNGIDLSGEGGLVWIKSRSQARDNILFDTERGATKLLKSNSTGAEVTTVLSGTSYGLTSFTSSGFTLAQNWTGENESGADTCSWTFRKAPGFFDIVTWTGDTTDGREISHDLGSTPGMVILKRTDAGGTHDSWHTFHRSEPTKYGALESDRAFSSTVSGGYNMPEVFGDSSSVIIPDANNITVSRFQNRSGASYVAYIFAHDDQSFGTDSDEAIIKCGTYTGGGSSETTVDLGFEPQWVIIKRTSASSDWALYDNMRGVISNASSGDMEFRPNQSTAETDENRIDFYAQGFKLQNDAAPTNKSGSTYIYMAIRRPHKPPEAATDVFGISSHFTGDNSNTRAITTGGVTADLILSRMTTHPTTFNATCWTDRIRGGLSLGVSTNQSDAESYWAGLSGWHALDVMDGYKLGGTTYVYSNYSSSKYISFGIKRAPGFFDIVHYTGTGSATTITHNLNATPSVVLIKGTDTTFSWYWQHYALGANTWVQLDNDEVKASNGSLFNNTLPTSSVFSVGSLSGVNQSTKKYIAYLFGDLDGISKAGTYSGTGNNINVDCGFAAGARFVLIKRTDSSGDWYLFDSVRGIVSGNDPHSLINGTAVQVTNTDYIDPLNAGFTVTSSAPAALNTSGGTYLFLAIA